jgi:hypothetical protein
VWCAAPGVEEMQLISEEEEEEEEEVEKIIPMQAEFGKSLLPFSSELFVLPVCDELC